MCLVLVFEVSYNLMCKIKVRLVYEKKIVSLPIRSVRLCGEHGHWMY